MYAKLKGKRPRLQASFMFYNYYMIYYIVAFTW